MYVRMYLTGIFAIAMLLGVQPPLTLARAIPVPQGSTAQTQSIGQITIRLMLFPAEPFIAATASAASGASDAMIAVSGAAPVRLDSDPRPNHHLIARILDRSTGSALTNAKVRISYRRLGSADTQRHSLPIAVMQIAGKGPASTHYGNNVRLAPGRYDVRVTVDGRASADFTVAVLR